MRACLALAMILLASACRRSKHPAGEEPLQRLEGFGLSQSTLGTPAWDLQARSAVLKEGDRRADLHMPTLTFYKKKRKVSTVTSRIGLVHTDTYDVTLTSDVVVHSLEDESTLTTEELRYSSQRKLFVTDKDVLVRRPGATMRGTGLEATPDLTDIKVFKQKTVMTEFPR